MNVVDQIKQLASDCSGEFLPSYLALRERKVGICTSDPDGCAAEANRRGFGNVNIYLAGAESVVCWPSVPAILKGNS